MTQEKPRRNPKPAPSAWAKSITDRVGSMVRRRRDALGLSAQALADACTELGYPMARNSVANLENGRRSEISVAELAIMAEVLKIPPVELLWGASLMSGEVEYLPGRTSSGWEAVKWFTGEVPHTPGELARALQSREGRLALMRQLDQIPARRQEVEGRLTKDVEELRRAQQELIEHGHEQTNAGHPVREILEASVRHAERMIEIDRGGIDSWNQLEVQILTALRDAGYVVDTDQLPEKGGDS